MTDADTYRFQRNVPATEAGACSEWTGGRTRHGYGRFYVGGISRRAHRVAFELAFGPIPVGLVVRHTCDNPPCVNPSHLVAGTVAENMRDKVERARTNSLKGENAGKSKLTAGAVVEIRARWASGFRRAR